MNYTPQQLMDSKTKAERKAWLLKREKDAFDTGDLETIADFMYADFTCGLFNRYHERWTKLDRWQREEVLQILQDRSSAETFGEMMKSLVLKTVTLNN